MLLLEKILGGPKMNAQTINKCLNEALLLRNEHFSPNVIYLSEVSVGNILFQVLLEWTLLVESDHFVNISGDVAETWRIKAEGFMSKWKEHVEIEDERALYTRFNKKGK